MNERGYDTLHGDMAVTELVTILQEMRRPEPRPATLHHFHSITGMHPG
jgi:hypothetical protein